MLTREDVDQPITLLEIFISEEQHRGLVDVIEQVWETGGFEVTFLHNVNNFVLNYTLVVVDPTTVAVSLHVVQKVSVQVALTNVLVVNVVEVEPVADVGVIV